MIYPMYCPKCEKKVEFRASSVEYTEEIKNKVECEDDGTTLLSDFSNGVRTLHTPIIDFRPHYNYGIGEFVNTKKEMFDKSDQKGVKLNRSY